MAAKSDISTEDIMKGEVLGQGKQSIVFKFNFNGAFVAVKRVDLLNTMSTKREEDALLKLGHVNIVRLLHVHQDPNFKYFFLEMCGATLSHFISKKYIGPMPRDFEALFQMAKGLRYIHQQQLVHRDINPDNIMVSANDHYGVQLKISDFALCKRLDQNISTSVGSVKEIAIWQAPELNAEDVDVKPATQKSDVFAMGCVFAYFLSRGTHPFGTKLWIITAQIANGRHDLSYLTTFLKSNLGLMDIIEGMIRYRADSRFSMADVCNQMITLKPPDANIRLDDEDYSIIKAAAREERSVEEKILEVKSSASLASLESKVNCEQNSSKIIYSHSQQATVKKEVPLKIPKTVLTLTFEERSDRVLGKGFQSMVYAKLLPETVVAVKRVIITATLLAPREEEALRKLNHPNIIKLFGVQEDLHFKYFALELCAGTVQDFCTGKYQGPMPSNYEALHQMACGLFHIHQNHFIHRDIKPENILISLPSAMNTVSLKLSDFGVCKLVNERGSASMSGVRGSHQWIAPELLPFLDVVDDLSLRQNVTTDIFALGCVFYYYLTNGRHPFGQPSFLVMANISQGLFDLSGLNDYNMQGIIAGMIQYDSNYRTNLLNVCGMLQQPPANPFQPVQMAFGYGPQSYDSF